MSLVTNDTDATRGSVPWVQLLLNKSSTMGLQLSSGQAEQFSLYARELVKWSRRINLTAIDHPEAIIVKHFLDSLAAIDQFADGDRLLDIGTGAGFPGLPLKLVRPSLSLTLIDGSRKKINFVSHLIRELGLHDISAVQTRSEQLDSDHQHRHAYDAVVSRAVCELKEFVRQAIDFVKPGGRILAWKGALADEEIKQFLNSAEHIKGIRTDRVGIRKIDYRLPGFEEKRCLVSVEIDS